MSVSACEIASLTEETKVEWRCGDSKGFWRERVSFSLHIRVIPGSSHFRPATSQMQMLLSTTNAIHLGLVMTISYFTIATSSNKTHCLHSCPSTLVFFTLQPVWSFKVDLSGREASVAPQWLGMKVQLPTWLSEHTSWACLSPQYSLLPTLMPTPWNCSLSS